MKKTYLSLLLSLALTLCFMTGCASAPAEGQNSGDEQQVSQAQQESDDETSEIDDSEVIYYDTEYTDPESVATYLYEWEELPPNFITKDEAQDLGWQSNKGNLWDVADGMSIGGDYFGNREGILPEGEEYRECDVNYEGGYRGSERLVYSIDDYDIYYTSDHYESFIQLFDAEEGYVGDLEIILD